jgi:hypothetical protein
MTPLNFAIVGLRLLGIYLIGQSATSFTTTAIVRSYAIAMALSGKFPARNLYAVSFVPGFVLGMVGLILVLLARPFARMLTPAVPNDAAKTAWSLEDVQAIAFAVAGIVILVWALPEFAVAVRDVNLPPIYPPADALETERRLGEKWITLIGVSVKVVIGLLLLLKAPAIARLWRRANTPK